MKTLEVHSTQSDTCQAQLLPGDTAEIGDVYQYWWSEGGATARYQVQRVEGDQVTLKFIGAISAADGSPSIGMPHMVSRTLEKEAE